MGMGGGGGVCVLVFLKTFLYCNAAALTWLFKLIAGRFSDSMCAFGFLFFFQLYGEIYMLKVNQT